MCSTDKDSSGNVSQLGEYLNTVDQEFSVLVGTAGSLFGALTLLIVWKIVEELNGNLFALFLTAMAIVFSALVRINTLYQPNSPDILFWNS